MSSRDRGDDTVELTVLMPCLDEAETVGACVRAAHDYMERAGIRGEVLVADNGSTDGSREIARRAGARVVCAAERGYGAALLVGIRAAGGDLIVMGDADDSYDFASLDAFVAALRAGADMVVGNRFAGGIAPGAMPRLHRYVGNPALSFLGRLMFGGRIADFHCGLRGFRRESVRRLDLRATGMEFASELVVKAMLSGQHVVEVPTTLRPAGRTRRPHLRSWPDGWRHLRFLLLYSPRWLFLYPGLLATLVGVVLMVLLASGAWDPGVGRFSEALLVASGGLVIAGFQAAELAIFAREFAGRSGLLPAGGARFQRFTGSIRLEWVLVTAAALVAAATALLVVSFVMSRHSDPLALRPPPAFRFGVTAVVAGVLGMQLAFGGWFLSLLRLPMTGRLVHVDEPEPKQ